MKKLKFYLFGVGLGVLFVFFILNAKGAGCSYFPNERVLAETLSKDFEFDPAVKTEMQELQIDEKFVRDSLLGKGKIDFSKSDARKEPCPEYFLELPSTSGTYSAVFEKCEKTAVFHQIKVSR